MVCATQIKNLAQLSALISSVRMMFSVSCRRLAKSILLPMPQTIMLSNLRSFICGIASLYASGSLGLPSVIMMRFGRPSPFLWPFLGMRSRCTAWATASNALPKKVAPLLPQVISGNTTSMSGVSGSTSLICESKVVMVRCTISSAKGSCRSEVSSACSPAFIAVIRSPCMEPDVSIQI